MAINWAEVQGKLDKEEYGRETDELIDSIAAEALKSPAEEATSILLRGLEIASGSLTKKSVSLAVAVCAPPGTVAAVDALVGAFRNASEDAFLGPAMLDALLLLGCRDTLALTELSSLLQRIDKHDNPHLVRKAATVCGRLLQTGLCPELRNKLTELSDSPYDEAATDARFYLACLETGEIVSANDRTSQVEALRKSAVAFQLAEPRPDAYAMGRLLELFLKFYEGGDNQDLAAEVSSTRAAFLEWPDYESPDLTFFLIGVERAIDALNTSKRAVDDAERWLDIQAGLVNLGRALQCLSTCGLGAAFATLEADLTKISCKIVRPAVGKVMQRAIGRARVEAAVRECEFIRHNGCDDLRDLLALLESVEADPQLTSEQAKSQLDRIAEATGRDPAEVIQELENAATTGRIEELVESLVPWARLLPVHEDVLYGNDFTVHRTVCRLLEELRDKLAPYDKDCWNRLKSTVATVVSFTYYIRDCLPQYCLCQDDGGMGQTASEGELQEDIFRYLRMQFGTQSIYEAGPIAGGRTDSGLRFTEVEFPIEIKHEFHHVNREHIRDNYLRQPSDYASARSRVTILLILDLRSENAAGHKERVKAAKKAKKPVSAHSLYTLNDSFWCESLPADPEIENAEQCVVVVGLVPGNRPKPSSQTTYSERPRAARKSAKKSNDG